MKNDNNDNDVVLPNDPRLEEVRSAIAGMVVDGGLASVAVAVVHGSSIAWQEAFGWADIENRKPATPHTRYRVASVSKSLTASGVMLLVQQGKLLLEASLEEYLGTGAFHSYRAPASDVQVRHILNMTGGIPHYWKYYYPDSPTSALPLPLLIERYGYAADLPGENFLYSNLSYTFAEWIIEKVSGTPFAEYMQSELFGPLKMLDTSTNAASTSTDEMATGYDPEGNPVQAGYWMEPGAGAGVVSTVHDLALFARAHLGISTAGQNPLFSPEVLKSIHHEHDPQAPNYGKYIMGWGIVDDGNYLSLISNGAMLGGAASILLLPTQQIAIVCVTNSTSRAPDQLVIQIADSLLPGFAEGWLGRVSLLEEEPPAQFDATDLLGTWEGKLATYEGDIPIRLIVDECGHIFVKIGSQLRGVVNDLSFSGTHMRGKTLGRISTEEAAMHNHDLELDLSYKPDTLFGTITAVTINPKPHFGLPHYIELNKLPAVSPQ